MSDEGRMILEQLSQINKNMTEMKTDIAELKTDVSELKEDVAVLKTDVAGLKEDVAVLKTDVAELKANVSVLQRDVRIIKYDMSVLKDKVIDLEEGQKQLRVLIEDDISKKINVVGEGHFFVMKSLGELRGFQEEKEMMDLKILDLQIEMKKIKQHLKIA